MKFKFEKISLKDRILNLFPSVRQLRSDVDLWKRLAFDADRSAKEKYWQISELKDQNQKFLERINHLTAKNDKLNLMIESIVPEPNVYARIIELEHEVEKYYSIACEFSTVVTRYSQYCSKLLNIKSVSDKDLEAVIEKVGNFINAFEDLGA